MEACVRELEIEFGGRVCTLAKADRAFACDVRRAGGELGFNSEIAVERSFRRKRKPRRPLLGREEAVEPGEFNQRSPIVALQPAIEFQLGGRERREDAARDRITHRARLGLHAQCAGTAVELEFRGGVARRRRIQTQRGAQRERRQTRRRAAQLLARRRSDFLHQRDDAVQRPRVDLERERAARRTRCGIDPSFDRQRRSAEVGDGEPRDLEAVRVAAHLHLSLLRLDPGDERARNLQRERALTRPIEGGIAEHRLGNGLDAVEIDFRCAQRGLESRRPVITRPGVGQPPSDRHAVDVEFQLVDRDGLDAHRYIAGEAQRTSGSRLLVAAFAQPSSEGARIAGLELGRSRELHAWTETPAQPQLAHARRAQLQTLDVDAIGIDFDLGSEAHQGCATKRNALGIQVQRRGNGKPRRLKQGFGKRLHGGERTPAHGLGQRQHPIEIYLR